MAWSISYVYCDRQDKQAFQVRYPKGNTPYFCHLTDLSMIAFHGVGSIDKFSDTSCKLEVFRKFKTVI